MIQTISQNLGWSCPVCNYCYSPATPSCYNCNRPDNEKYVTTTTTIVHPNTATQICMCTKNGPGMKFGTHCGECGGLITNFTVTST